MVSVNKVTILGNIGRDPVVRSSPSGAAFAQVCVATTERWKDQATGEYQEQTEWHRVVFSHRRAEVAGSCLKKGSRVYIEGRLRTRKWTDKAGVERHLTEIIGDTLITLDRHGDRKQSEARQQGAQVTNQADNAAVDDDWVADYDRYLAAEAAAEKSRAKPPQMQRKGDARELRSR